MFLKSNISIKIYNNYFVKWVGAYNLDRVTCSMSLDKHDLPSKTH